MTSILGIDLSSFQLDACLLIDGQPPVLRRERLGTSKEPLIERVRRIPNAILRLTMVETRDDLCRWRERPDWIVIESAYGHGAHALHLTTGAIIASCPAESQIATISSGDWRRALNVPNTKAMGHFAVREFMNGEHSLMTKDLDEHELDAIGIACGWRRILALHATPDCGAPNE